MDVKPAPDETAEAPPAVLPAGAPRPVNDVTPPELVEAPPPEAAVKQAAPTKAKQSANNSVTVAIVATVIIVFGLAVLAVLAYLKQK